MDPFNLGLTPFNITILLGVSHFVGDFLLQSNWMALNKSKRLMPLLCHALVYSACFVWMGMDFACLTFAAHLITDMITSQFTSALWFVRPGMVSDGPYEVPELVFDARKRHWFFVMIGLDQLIHFVTLLYTFKFVATGGL